jgi:hypothetical protein
MYAPAPDAASHAVDTHELPTRTNLLHRIGVAGPQK